MDLCDSGTREARRKSWRLRVVCIVFSEDRHNLELTPIAAHKLISSLVCDAQRNFIAAGIENPEDGAGVSPVYVWYACAK